VRLTIPMTMGIASFIVFSFADAYFVAQLGVPELSAMSFTFPIAMVFGCVFGGLGAGTASVVARAIGHGEPDAIKRLTTDSLTLALLAAIFLATLGLFTMEPVFAILGADAETIPLIWQYMVVWYPGAVLLSVPMVGNSAIRATGDTKYPAIIIAVAALVNIILDPLLIFGLAGFPRLGLMGAALATAIAQALTCVAALAILHFREEMLELLRPRWTRVLDSWRQILRIGLPAALTMLLDPLFIAVVTRLAARFGQSAVASLGAGFRIIPLLMIPAYALGSAIMPFIGQNWGAKRFDRAQEGRKQGYLLIVSWSVFCAAMFLLFGDWITGMFTDDAEVARQTALFLRIVPLGFAAGGVFNVSWATLNAIDRPMDSAGLLVVAILLFFIPFAHIGAYAWQLTGLFVAFPAAELACGAISLFWCNRICSAEIAKIAAAPSDTAQ
jgi:putative MATE family efflux protein